MTVGFVGAGNFALRTLVPAFHAAGANLHTVASCSGLSGYRADRRHGFHQVTTDLDAVFQQNEINAVVVATRHDTHSALVQRALESGKHVYVEKPLAITSRQLDDLEATYAAHDRPPIVMTGFNRRFAPHAVRMRELLATIHEPKAITMTVNAGEIPAEHWIHDPHVGGGRIIGEACHFVDLLRFLVGAPIREVQSLTVRKDDDRSSETASIGLAFADGSCGTVHYFANGPRGLSKERLEVFCAGRVLQLDNFRVLRALGWPRTGRMRLLVQNKGHKAAVSAFVNAVEHGDVSPIPMTETLEVMRATLQASTQQA